MKPISLKLNLFSVLIVFLFCFHKCCSAKEPNVDLSTRVDSGNPKIQQKSTGGYCGIYCLYATMKYFGVTVKPNVLIKPEYIGSAKGSSLAELKKCAESHGLYATPVARLTTKDLRKLSLPVIIHTKSSSTVKKYDHYKLFLGSKLGQALIYDPPQLPELIEFWTLAPQWDGSGLLVSDKPIRLNAVFASSRLRFTGYVGLAAAIIMTVRFGRYRFLGPRKIDSRKQKLLLSFGQCSFLVMATILSASAYHSINDEGLLLRSQSTKAIQQAYKSSFVSKTAEKKSQLTTDTK